MQSSPLTAIDLLLHAGPVVKAVLVMLALMSVWSWAIIARCAFGVVRLRGVLRRLAASGSPLPAFLVDAAMQEWTATLPGETTGEHRERVVARMRRRIHALVEVRQSGLGSLAVIASSAPFIGLFGTVWGIMESFIGIASAKDTSLAVVAPGIAEALAATAVGLVVAIPATFAYNRLAAGFTLVTRRLVRTIEDRATALLQQPTRPADAVPPARQ